MLAAAWTRRWLLAAVACQFVSAAQAAPADPALAAGRKLLLAGKYAEAAEVYEPLAKQSPAARLGLARCYEAQGDRQRAEKLLADAEEPPLLAEAARLAFDRSDYPTAQSRAEAAVRDDRKQPLARWILAELDRFAGRTEAADKAYRALVRHYNDQANHDTESLRWIGLAAAQNARWNRLADQFDFLVNDLYPDALKIEPNYWPARYEAGLLFLEKHNRADAARQFQAALEINPNAAEVHAALAALALEGRDVEKAEAALRRAQEINPQLLEAWLLRADLIWVNFQPAETLRLLEQKALPLRPLAEETLGRVAACYLLLDGLPQGGAEGRFARLCAEVARRNPRCGEFYAALADCLDARNKQPEAERYYREALRVMPRQIGPSADLGLLLMRVGREAEARKLLDEAFRADPFHVRVNNMLEVLDVLDAMGTSQSPRFTVRHDAEHDALWARYALRRLDEFHPQLCELLGSEPPRPSLFEVFHHAKGLDGHHWFSARMTGLPYVGTVAASTGRIVAMASPNELPGRRFSWARVLKHEYVHVITLQQTQFNIPHWYTEGLAVWCEGFPQPPSWNTVLAARLAKDRLFTLDTINFGFRRPQSHDDWTLAYCQAELYVEFMLGLGGEPALRKLLAAYTAGLDTPAAIEQVFQLKQPEFERRYRAYVAQQAAAWSRLVPLPQGEMGELLAAHRRRPDDADAAAALAHAHLARRANAEADEICQRGLKLQPKHPLATYVKARLLLGEPRAEKGESAGDQAAEVMQMLDAALDRQAPHAAVLTLLASLRLKARQYDEAAQLYALGAECEPDNPFWPRWSARVCLLTKDEKQLTAVLRRVAQLDADDFGVRRRLAQRALAEGDHAGAVEWALAACDIEVCDAEVHRVLGRALTALGKREEAEAEMKTAATLKTIEEDQSP